jgi:chromosome partitioning protein
MTRVAVLNQKGGVGKTTTVLNLGAALARNGHAPLLIDLDPQAHLTNIVGPRPDYGRDSVFGFYSESIALRALEKSIRWGGALVPAHAELMKVDATFGKGPNILNRLADGLAELQAEQRNRPVLIDCCPLMGVLMLNAIFAADLLLIPVSSDFLAVQGSERVERTLKALEPVLRRRVARRYLVTRFDGRRKMSWDILRGLEANHGAELCATRINENVSLAESPSRNLSVFGHAPSSRGARDYADLLQELIDQGLMALPEVAATSSLG